MTRGTIEYAAGMSRRLTLFAVIGPGLLIAATGVGAGDLAAAGLAGSRLGVAVAWAVLVGAMMKFVITEGLARWQIATGTTLLEGVAAKLGRPAQIVFLVYLLVWTFTVGGALISASSASFRALFLPSNPNEYARIGIGAAHSLIGLALVMFGGFKLFSRVMAVAIGVMVAAVLIAAFAIGTDPGALAHGLGVPSIPSLPEGASPDAKSPLSWVVSLIGGVGGTVTVLCYGYWIRETKTGVANNIKAVRIDLFVGYTLTALFGVSMLVIASGVGPISGSGVSLLVQIAERLESAMGLWAGKLFLVGAWAAIFSSLLGVWQAVPYLFADLMRTMKVRTNKPAVANPVPLTKTFSYKAYMIGIATVPMLGMVVSFETIQRAYTIFGAAFVPMLALTLLILNSRRAWVGEYRNTFWSTAALIMTLAFFVWVGVLAVM